MSLVAELSCPAECEPAGNPLSTDRAFVLLCTEEMRGRYEQVLSSTGVTVKTFHSLESLLAECLQHPPHAILLDMGAVTRMGAVATTPVFELDIDWPVMRCKLLPGGSANYMCLEPMRFGALNEAVREIAVGAPGWTGSRSRTALRVNINCRVAIRRVGQSDWRPSNSIDISVVGMFLVTYESWSPGERVELEIRDLTAQPLAMAAEVVRQRRWENTLELPGVALRFMPGTVTPEFRRALARPEHIDRLLHTPRRTAAPVVD